MNEIYRINVDGSKYVYTLDSVLRHVDYGWHDILRRLIHNLFKAGWDGNLQQIKEKFGSLRFYTGPVSYELRELINKAEEESSITCEKCAQPGYLDGGYYGWLKTYCEYHHKQRAEETNKREQND